MHKSQGLAYLINIVVFGILPTKISVKIFFYESYCAKPSFRVIASYVFLVKDDPLSLLSFQALAASHLDVV